MRQIYSKILCYILVIATFTACDDDSIFDIKLKTQNGITTVSGIRPGGLKRAVILNASTIKNLVITDSIDSRDFKTIRDDMTNLETLDLTNATIVAYNGYDGTAGSNRYYYKANEIPAFAFYNQSTATGKTLLKEILFPENLKSIGDYAFSRCGLTGEVNLPVSMTDTIGISAFAYCQNITKLNLSPVSYIGPSAFQNCSGIAGQLIIPESVKTIQSWAFSFCPAVKEISLPSTLEILGKAVFCGSGNAFSINKDNPYYIVINSVLFTSDGGTLVQFPGLKTGNFAVPESVFNISSYSFAFCTGLTGLTLPESTLFIEDNAFYNCTALTGNFPIPASLIYIGINVFEGCNLLSGFSIANGNTTFQYTNGVLSDVGQSTLKKCLVTKSGDYTISNDIMFIDNSAFSNCTNLSSVTIPENVIIIGNRAFFNCTGLIKIVVKNPVPIDISQTLSAFELVKKEDITLYVPKGYLQNYLNATGWNEFGNVVEN